MSERIVLGGRAYVTAQDITIGQEIRVRGLLSASGLDDLPMHEHESAEDYVRRLLDHLTGSPQVLELMGTLILPDGMKPGEWTPDVARETAAHISKLTSLEDRVHFQTMVSAAFLGFLESGLISLERSLTSSLVPPNHKEDPRAVATANGAS